MSAPTGSRKLSAALREMVAAHLSAEGFEGVSATTPYTRLSEGIDTIGVPDIVGVPDTWLDVPARGSHRLSADLDSAKSDALSAGYPRAVVVAHRPGRPTAESYAVMTLSDFAALARAATANA